jgi:hypothetical protein
MRILTQAKLGLCAAILALAACASTPAQAPVSRIVSTTSFGMCVGYCTTTLEISEGQAVLIRQARGGRGGPSTLPDQRFAAALSPAEWTEISGLAAHTDLSGLPATIGCPDCADGGAETLSINGAAPITFDHGANIAQAQPLLERIRALRERLTPAQ